jgi:Tfp pilus assembly protein PilF
VALIVCLGLLGGLLAKEDALAFAPLLLAAAWRDPARRRGAFMGLLLAVLIYLVGRWTALGGPFVGPSTPALAGLTLAERVRFGGLAFAEALRIVIWPVDAPPRYTPELLLRRGELLGVPFTATVGALAWLGLLVPALLVLTRRSVRGWTLGRGAASLVALAFLPVSQLVPIGEVFAPRFLYLPLLFATPLLLLAADLLSAAWRPALVSSLLLLLSIGCFVRAKDYADAGAWNRAVLREDPSDARAWNNLGLYHEACGDAGAAQAAWQRAAQLEPSYSKPWSNLGRLHFQAQDYELALVDWRRALELGPRNPVAHVNLASLLTRLDQHAQAEELYARATELAPGLSAAWRGLALARLRQGDLAGARSAWGRASQLDPTDRATQALEERLLRAEQEAESRR